MTDGKKKKKKTLKLTPSETGARMYMSEDAKKKFHARPRDGSAIEQGVNKAYSAARRAKKLTPEESGRKKAGAFIDMSARTYGIDNPKKYAKGGMVCRGMGAATKGGKYKP